ncbi:Ankyrin repeat and SOCS box protein 12 [Perkinsus olseni]|uniref:Ankyrin repeat and SOCS box protein 12 n=1 Tax=Perkinsus olseni TaxID=32597 RepID=A0A7J6PCM3_PEROL|nr:Ankyrin repeat and SOCS box protein 12 [Perkinsus olseni]
MAATIMRTSLAAIMETDAEGDPAAVTEEVLDVHAANKMLLEASAEDDTAQCSSLLAKRADPTCRDAKVWTPLTWAASNGNETVTRSLLSRGGGVIFRTARESLTDAPAKTMKHTPLHWAAFKGHLKIVWLLLKDGMSPYDVDHLGNTVLHQAAAGGSAEVVSCLLAQGCDVAAKNVRGHEPIALCTAERSRAMLKRAMSAHVCYATGTQFSAKKRRFLCEWTRNFFCDSEVVRGYAYNNHSDKVPERPFTYCEEVADNANACDNRLNKLMQRHSANLEDLEKLQEELEEARTESTQWPCDVKVLHEAEIFGTKIASSIALRKAELKGTYEETPEQSSLVTIVDELASALDAGAQTGVAPGDIKRARLVRTRALCDLALLRAIEDTTKGTAARLDALHKAIGASERESANPRLIAKGQRLRKKLEVEDRMSRHLASVEPMVGITSLRGLEEELMNSLPEWAKDSEKFLSMVDDFAATVDEAASLVAPEGDSVGTDEALFDPETFAEWRIASDNLHRLFSEKKQLEEEAAAAAAKKKKGKKKK